MGEAVGMIRFCTPLGNAIPHESAKLGSMEKLAG